jgi:hypothetical protein
VRKRGGGTEFEGLLFTGGVRERGGGDGRGEPGEGRREEGEGEEGGGGGIPGTFLSRPRHLQQGYLFFFFSDLRGLEG